MKMVNTKASFELTLSVVAATVAIIFFSASTHAEERGATSCDLAIAHYKEISDQLKETCKSANFSSYITSCIRQAGECEYAINGAGGLEAVVKNPGKLGRSCPAIAQISVASLKDQKEEMEKDIDRLSKEIEKYRKEERESKKEARQEKKDTNEKIANLNKDIAGAQKDIMEKQSDTSKEMADAEKDNADKINANQELLEKALASLSEADQIYAKALEEEESRCDSFTDQMLKAKLEVMDKQTYYGSFNARGKSINELAGFRGKMRRHCRAEPRYTNRLASAAASRKSGTQLANEQVARVQQKTQADAARHAQAQQMRQVAGAQSVQAIQGRISTLTNEKAQAADDLADAQEEIADSKEQSEQQLKTLSSAFKAKKAKLEKINKALDALRGQTLPSSGGSGEKNAANVLSIVEAGDEYFAVRNKVEAGNCKGGHAISANSGKRDVASDKRSKSEKEESKKAARKAVRSDVPAEGSDFDTDVDLIESSSR